MIKTHGHVSTAKKAMWHTSVLFTHGCVNGQESHVMHKCVTYLQELLTCHFQPLVSLYPLCLFLSNSHMLCLPYTQLYLSNLKEISPVVYEICVSENFPIFFTFFFFFALFTKINLSQPKAPFSSIDFFLI